MTISLMLVLKRDGSDLRSAAHFNLHAMQCSAARKASTLLHTCCTCSAARPRQLVVAARCPGPAEEGVLQRQWGLAPHRSWPEHFAARHPSGGPPVGLDGPRRKVLKQYPQTGSGCPG